MLNLLQHISVMLNSQTYRGGIESSKNKMNLHVLQSLFESLKHTQTLVRHSMTLWPSYCSSYSCISCCIRNQHFPFTMLGLTDVKFIASWIYVGYNTHTQLFIMMELFVFVQQYAIQGSTAGLYCGNPYKKDVTQICCNKIRSRFTGVVDILKSTIELMVADFEQVLY